MVIEAAEAIPDEQCDGEWRPKIRGLMEKPTPLHRFVDKMSGYSCPQCNGLQTTMRAMLRAFGQRIRRALRWCTAFRSSTAWVQKIANMAANILARHFKIPFADYHSIDISADVHVRRLFGRLGLCALPLPSTSSPTRRGRCIRHFPGSWTCQVGSWQELV
jgi:endonuclease III